MRNLLVAASLVLVLLGGGFLRNRNAVPTEVREVRPQSEPRRIIMKVTAYDPDYRCTGRWSRYKKTATGKDARILDGVAADFGLLPPGTRLWIPDVGKRMVDDTGGAMRQSAKKGIHHIDVRMATHKEAQEFGVRWALVEIAYTPPEN